MARLVRCSSPRLSRRECRVSANAQDRSTPVSRSAVVKHAALGGMVILGGSLAPTSSASVSDSQPAVGTVTRLNTLRDCSLAVSIYPTFAYNAAGGGGEGRVVAVDGDVLAVEFDAASLQIPAIDYRSTKVVGVPIPPPLRIEIIPKELKGTINIKTGEANLDFDAAFQFDAGSLYHAAPLSVVTRLSSEGSEGRMLRGPGTRLDEQGKLKLAGVARVPKTGDGFLDSFLLLPSEALAVLSAEIQFS